MPPNRVLCISNAYIAICIFPYTAKLIIKKNSLKYDKNNDTRIIIHTGGHGSPHLFEHFEWTQRFVHHFVHGGQSMEHKSMHGWPQINIREHFSGQLKMKTQVRFDLRSSNQSRNTWCGVDHICIDHTILCINDRILIQRYKFRRMRPIIWIYC